MKEQLDVLRDRFEIQAVDPTTMTLRTERYDALHMADNPTNRKHAITLITGAAEAHIGYLELIALDDQLRKLPRLENPVPKPCGHQECHCTRAQGCGSSPIERES